ncbi:hypothetical protein RSAG8_06807, partial [Rhizoctonia solani AG-8 WAC10335]
MAFARPAARSAAAALARKTPVSLGLPLSRSLHVSRPLRIAPTPRNLAVAAPAVGDYVPKGDHVLSSPSELARKISARVLPQIERPDVRKVVVVGSGGLSIGQAGEFDYSGSQAMKALREAGVEAVLINPNIATWQTSHQLASEVYFLPITADYVAYVLEKERPDGVLLTFGGQSALNVGIELDRMGVLERLGVKVLGTPIRTLEISEDRELFVQALNEIDIPVARSTAVSSVNAALAAGEAIGYPVILRSAFTLGGLGSGFANDPDELRDLAAKSLSLSPQVLIERSMKGWKELEYEVVRDAADVDPRWVGFEAYAQPKTGPELDRALSVPTDMRLFVIAHAMYNCGYTVDRIHDLTKIDKWYLYKIDNIVQTNRTLKAAGSLKAIDEDLMHRAKKMGFSDQQIASLTGSTEAEARAHRKSLGVTPFVKRIDTLAAEYPAHTNYLYTTYNASEHDVEFDEHGTFVLGSGVYRIGSSVEFDCVEFDWCAVTCARSLREGGRRTIMINYNPETVSTDYDEADRMYFEELGFERVMDIYELEQAQGVIVSVGGQLPQNIALRLKETGINVLGTDPSMIDTAEDRHKFSGVLDKIGVDQPEWTEVTSLDAAKEFANRVNYPVLIRPSYVLSGAAMNVVYEESTLEHHLSAAASVSPLHPVVITKFIDGAQEIDVDAVAHKGKLLIHAVSEHVENAGVHSGDATLVLPPFSLPESDMARLKEIAEKVAQAFEISGPFNMQIIRQDKGQGEESALKVIECNLRASRSFPFVSKVLGKDFIQIATAAITGENVPEPVDLMKEKRDYYSVKVAQFSWTRLGGADPFLGVEMASTGEVASFGKDVHEAYWASLLSTTGFKPPKLGSGVLIGGDITKPEMTAVAKQLIELGFKLYCSSHQVEDFLNSIPYVACKRIFFPTKDKRLLREVFDEYNIQCVVNLAKSRGKDATDEDYVARRNAVDFGLPLLNNARCAQLFVEALAKKIPEGALRPYYEGRIPSEVKSWREFVGHAA